MDYFNGARSLASLNGPRLDLTVLCGASMQNLSEIWQERNWMRVSHGLAGGDQNALLPTCRIVDLDAASRISIKLEFDHLGDEFRAKPMNIRFFDARAFEKAPENAGDAISVKRVASFRQEYRTVVVPIPLLCAG
jgi:hypothetical protein